jgi:acetyltransferase-like isoleucine patch superfamily enzyme
VVEWVASRGSLRSPWSSIFEAPDISIGDDCECAGATYIESGVTLGNGSGTGTLSRIACDTAVKEGQRVVGNPANLKLSSKLNEQPRETKPVTFVGSMRAALLCVHLGYLLFVSILVLEIIRDLPLEDVAFIFRLPVMAVTAYILAVVFLFLELLFAKKLLFGRTRTESFPFSSLRGMLFHQMQVIVQLIELLVMPVFGGTYVLVFYYRAVGARIDGWTSVFINSFGYVDSGDADNTTIREFAVMDESTMCVAHRVDYGTLNNGSVLLNSGAVLHPGSILMLGSLGRGSQLFPLSKLLREIHVEDDQVWIGNPAMQARCQSNEKTGTSPAEDTTDRL